LTFGQDGKILKEEHNMYGVFGGITTIFHTVIRFPFVVAVVVTIGTVIHTINVPLTDVPVTPVVLVQGYGEIFDNVLKLRNVNFDTNSAKLTSKAKKELDFDVQYAKQNPTVKLDLTGYCDPRGSNDLNQPLSEARANSVRNYLLEHGISSDRISIKGRSFMDLFTIDRSPKGLAADRRVEVKAILKYSK
jgi:hypothetical protein